MTPNNSGRIFALFFVLALTGGALHGLLAGFGWLLGFVIVGWLLWLLWRPALVLGGGVFSMWWAWAWLPDRRVPLADAEVAGVTLGLVVLTMGAVVAAQIQMRRGQR